ncbi:hypothetical protein T11_3926 [Trichinella zimbabwensis]|uniref:Uncharacterized protein n=1 Tax=Trichinella zimbabwensis TaxID=268475 RepID=A0A0V1GHK6_9BILA|nr:hypothetical protein T11_3926 [Trichinella zimbabwensis]
MSLLEFVCLVHFYGIIVVRNTEMPASIELKMLLLLPSLREI